METEILGIILPWGQHMHLSLEFRESRIGAGRSCPDGELLHFLGNGISVLQWLREFKGDYFAIARLRAFLLRTSLPLYRLDDNQVLEQITHLISSGRLHLCRKRSGGFASGGSAAGASADRSAVAPAESPPPTPVTEPRRQKTWIEIELVDGQDRPVADEKYRIRLTDGSTREGTLNAQGRARFDEIDPGTCEVSFPNLDGHEWRAA